MATAPDTPATSWRDIADQLTPEQITRLEGFELDNPDTVETRTSLLATARDWAVSNVASVAVYGGVPTPAGAVKVGPPSLDDDLGIWQRAFSGTTRTVGDFDVCIEGEQMPSGEADRWIAFDAESVPAVGGTLTAHLARLLAAALVEAADELDRLAVVDGVVLP